MIDIGVEKLSFGYVVNNHTIKVLDNINIKFEAGSYTCIRGKSGSGKSTLLKIIGLLEVGFSGVIRYGDQTPHTDQQCSLLRAQTIGFLFQDFRLIPTISVYENIRLALAVANQIPESGHKSAVESVVDRVGLIDRLHHFPAELSGGELQRIALCRALVKQPKVLMADEPTGNLDHVSRDIVLDIVKTFNQQGGTVVMVTHDDEVANHAASRLILSHNNLSQM